MRDIIFLGGDERMRFARERLGEKYNCSTDTAKDSKDFGYAVLPVQKSTECEIIFGTDIKYSSLPRFLKKNAVVLTGHNCPLLKKICGENGFSLINYAEEEAFAVANAVPTAEGAVAIAINSRKETLFKSNILITGYGRISKILSGYMLALGGKVRVACRKKSDLEWTETRGLIPIDITDKDAFLKALACSDIIFNTVPAEIFGKEEINAVKSGAVYIELASSDGFGDEKPNFPVIIARGLPGKTAPITAGKIIADTIASIIAERSENYEL